MQLRFAQVTGHFLFALAIISIAAPLPAQTAEWKAHDYPADGFRVTFPVAPEVSKENIPTDAGPVELHLYTASVGNTALNISVCDYGTKAAAVDPDNILAGVEKGAIDNWKAKVASENKIALGVNHGLAVEAENDSMHFSLHYYMVGGVLYQTMVVSPAAEKFPDAKRFLDSFQLIPRTAN